mgnify:CR=1 FL=1|jgi:hypothetical protein
MTKKVKNNYIDNKRFYDTICEYKQKVREAAEAGKEKPEIPYYAANAIRLIAENMAKRYHKFSRYSYNDEMVGDAILNCIKYFDNFDETRFKNPHAYFTKICLQSNVLRIKIEHKNQYVKYKSFVNDSQLSGDPDIVFHDKHNLSKEEVYDNISTFISDYERKENERKRIRKEKSDEKKLKDSLERYL